jgi:hypothetical protein
MPFVLLALGVLFLAVAWNNTTHDLFALLKSEFVGTNSFIPWVAALLILGLAGYIKPIRPVTHAFMVLIIIVLVLANGGGVFARFNDAIRNPIAPSGAPSGTGTVITGALNTQTPSATPDVATGAALGGMSNLLAAPH